LTRSEYDRGVNTFSREGRLFQVEYAIEAIKLGTTAIGIKTKEGVFLGVEKRLASTLLEPSSVQKIVEIDSHIGAAQSGLTSDARTLVDRARIDAQNHRFTYDEPIKVSSLMQSICDLCLAFGEDKKDKIMSRPFGVALLLAGMDDGGPQLYCSDPSGTYVEYKAKAIGSGWEGAQKTLEENYSDEITLAEAEILVVSTLKEAMEASITNVNIELAKVTSEGYKVYTPAEADAVIARLDD